MSTDTTTNRSTLLVRVSGRDRPGITAGLLGVLARNGAEIYDMEQVVVRERLTLGILISVPAGEDVVKNLLFYGFTADITIDFEFVESTSSRSGLPRFAVTVLANPLTPAALARVAEAISDGGGNIDRIVRLSRYPVVSYEFVVVNGDLDLMRERLVEAAHTIGIDIAIQRESLERRSKRLVVLDMDSTLIQDEVIELIADECGVREQVAEITERAMNGEIDFGEALKERVALLAGLDVARLDVVRERVRLTPGARLLTRTLKRMGFKLAVVSGGFTFFTDWLAEELGLDHAFANELEVKDGKLTGRVTGPIVDRARKAVLLREVAALEGIPIEQTVAVGDGANDLDMLAAAGLGVAFNAKPVVRQQADTTVNVPYLDAILFMLGVRREDVEAADRADPDHVSDRLVPVDGLPPF